MKINDLLYSLSKPKKYLWSSFLSYTGLNVCNFTFLRICLHLLEKPLIENFIFCAVTFSMILTQTLENFGFFKQYF